MKIKAKSVIGFVVVAICIVICGMIDVSAEEYFDSLNGVKWTYRVDDLDAGKKVDILSCSTSRTRVSVPREIEGYPVYKIGYECFKGCSSLEYIQIYDNITIVGEKAFQGCTALKSIEIPDSVTYMGYDAFNGCKKLENVNLGSGMTTMEIRWFENCTALERITIPEGFTNIGGSAFYGCYNLKEVIIPETVTSIDGSAFRDCKGLESIKLPDSISNIGTWVFEGCSSLTAIYYYGSEEQWDKVTVGGYNAKLVKCLVFAKFTRTEVSDDKKSFIITPVNIDNGNMVILALYGKDGELVEAETAVYDNDAVQFSAKVDYDYFKVFVWDDLQNIVPITNQ